MRVRVTRVQTYEFDTKDYYYVDCVTFGEVRRIETAQVEDEGDKYFEHRGRGTTEIIVEQIEEERQVA